MGSKDERPMENLWTETAGAPMAMAAIQEDVEADVAIVGGGFTGCAAALAAASAGASVRLLERERIGHGGSGRNVGLVNAGLWLAPDDVEGTLGEAAGRRLNTALADGPKTVFRLVKRHAIDCEATRNGTLHCAHAASAMAELSRRDQQQRAREAPVALLSAGEARERTGSRRVHGALFDARAGTIQPLAYCRGLARAAAAAGAILHEGTPVTAMTRAAGRWRLATPGGTVHADRVVVATNAYATHDLGGATVPLNYFQLATEPLGHNLGAAILPGGEGCWDTAKVMSSFRKDAAGRLVIGAVGSLTHAGGRIHAQWAQRTLARLFPDAAGARFAHAWQGRIAMTSDHIPKIVSLGPGAYSVFGYSGRGISPGTVFGTALGRLVAGGTEADLPLAPVPGHAEPRARLRAAAIELGATAWHALRR